MTSADASCRIICLGASALAGLGALWLTSGAVPVLGALMFSGALAAILDLSLSRIACEDKGMGQSLRRLLGLEPEMAPDPVSGPLAGAQGETPRTNRDKTTEEAPGKGREEPVLEDKP